MGETGALRSEKVAVDEALSDYHQTCERDYAPATTLTYLKWLSLNHNPPISDQFWREVRTMFESYRRAKADTVTRSEQTGQLRDKPLMPRRASISEVMLE